MATKKQKGKKNPKKENSEFTSKTRLYDLVRKEYHEDLRLFVKEIRPWLIDGDKATWKTLKMLEINHSSITNNKFLLIVANFLHRIGCKDGLKCRMSVFIRYLASDEHTNFELTEGSVKVQIYRMLSYLRSKEYPLKNGSTRIENNYKVCYGNMAKFGSCPYSSYLCSKNQHKQ